MAATPPLTQPLALCAALYTVLTAPCELLCMLCPRLGVGTPSAPPRMRTALLYMPSYCSTPYHCTTAAPPTPAPPSPAPPTAAAPTCTLPVPYCSTPYPSTKAFSCVHLLMAWPPYRLPMYPPCGLPIASPSGQVVLPILSRNFVTESSLAASTMLRTQLRPGLSSTTPSLALSLVGGVYARPILHNPILSPKSTPRI